MNRALAAQCTIQDLTPPQSGLRFSRKARSPSWPSSEARRSAIASQTSSRTLSDGTAVDAAHQGLGRRHRPRRRLQQLVDALVDGGVERVELDHPVDEPDRGRPLRREALAGQEELARRRDADLPHDVGRDDGRHEAEPHLGEPELGALLGHHDVGHGGEAGPAAERRALHAGDHRLRRAVDRLEQLEEAAASATFSSRVKPAIVFIHSMSAPAQKTDAAPGEDDHADVVPHRGGAHRVVQLAHHRPRRRRFGRRAGPGRRGPPARRARATRGESPCAVSMPRCAPGRPGKGQHDRRDAGEQEERAEQEGGAERGSLEEPRPEVGERRVQEDEGGHLPGGQALQRPDPAGVGDERAGDGQVQGRPQGARGARAGARPREGVARARSGQAAHEQERVRGVEGVGGRGQATADHRVAGPRRKERGRGRARSRDRASRPACRSRSG